MIIRNITIKGHDYINVPANTETLIEMGLNEQEAAAEVNKAKVALAMEARKRAYHLESDPLFIEAIRKEAMGDLDGAAVARNLAVSLVEQIKSRYPVVDNA
ncbi:hypothetical protein [Pseudoalteromonas luteoviolacea]|uniref:Uncharacterized protein n=1 Tax=Pseudoalteromonas luteoviolacea S4060-1 TaxID=1365257 RepID=A0A167JRK4_9GAMM|nr:hypothetical protein [Pseudoalteromonas luteoviolacea]KZN61562.1 hypothetical protein N478_05710 [Pseudoalteromonas luteoviolacea S4060-1]